jgi:hypothetical protein
MAFEKQNQNFNPIRRKNLHKSLILLQFACSGMQINELEIIGIDDGLIFSA